MKTQRWSAFKWGVVGAGITVVIAATRQPDVNDRANDSAASASADTTNTASLTNAPSPGNQPRAAVAPIIPASPGIADVVKLAQSGVESGVLLAYVRNSPTAYNPTADELVYLHDVGIPPEVVTAMIERGNSLRDQPANAAPANPGYPPIPSYSAETAASAPAADAVPPAAPPAGDAGYPAASPSYVAAAPMPAPATVPAPVNSFYDTLAPYGTWYDLPDYGWCWQPTVAVVQPLWRPYCDYGRWFNSDCGWYWQSDYSWGWAPFHYGRWCRAGRFGWMWVPGTVWGPAWVCWRQTPQYCGWAPLPPAAVYSGGGFTYLGAGVGVGFGFGLGVADFTFVSFGHFCDRNPAAFRLSPVVAGNVFRQTTVNNYYFSGPNGKIVNAGVDLGRVAGATRAEIPKVTIRDLTPAAGKQVKPDQVGREGSTLVVYRPQSVNQLPARPGSPITYNRREPVTASAIAGPANPAAARPFTTRAEIRSSSSPATPFLGRYPTQTSSARPYYEARTTSGSLPAPVIGNTPANFTRPEMPQNASGGIRPSPPVNALRPEGVTTVRPSFYNPPPITQPAPRSATEFRSSAPGPDVARNPAPAVTPQNPRADYYRVAPAPSYARPQAPSYYRAPAYSSGPSPERSAYGAPQVQPRSAPSRPAYQPVQSYSGSSAASGRSAGNASRPATTPSSRNY